MKKITFIFMLLAIIKAQGQVEFQKHLNQNQFSATDSYVLSNGVLIRGLSSNGNDEGICLVSDSGTVLWRQFFSQGSTVTKAIMAPKNDLEYFQIVTGDSIFLSKTNNFQYQWRKKFTINSTIADSNYSWGVSKIEILKNGDLCAIGNAEVPIFGGFGIANSPIVMLFDSTGTLKWSKMFQLGNHSFTPNDICENSTDSLIISGVFFRTDGVGLSTINGIGTLQLKHSDGTITGTGGANTYINNDSELQIGNIDDENKTIVTNGLNFINTSPHSNSSFIFKFNENGALTTALRLDDVNSNKSIITYLSKTVGNITYLVGQQAITDTSTIMTSVHPMGIKLDAFSGSFLVWAKNYGTDYEGKITEVKVNSDNTLLLNGKYGNNMGYFWKANAQTGNAACNSSNIDLNISNYSFSSTLIPMTVLSDNFLNTGSDANTTNDNQITSPALTMVNVCVSGGIDSPEGMNKDFQLYPNPAKNNVTIKTNLVKGDHFYIYDIFGRKIGDYYTTNEHQNTIDVSSLSSGIYFVTLVDKSGVQIVSKKLLIE